VPRLDMQEWETRSPDDTPTLAGLRLALDTRSEELLTRAKACGVNVLRLERGVEIQTSSWVGQITLGELTVRIQPKIAGLPLAQLLRYAYRLRDLVALHQTAYAISSQSFIDLLLQQLAQEASDLVARGLHRDYVRIHASLTCPRGRISFSRIATVASLPAGTLPCTYFNRLEDILLNRILLAGIRLGCRLATDRDLRQRLSRLAESLESGISPVALTVEILRAAHRAIDRRTARYSASLTLIDILHSGLSPVLAGPTQEVPFHGFLFDMNRFFQTLLSRFLHAELDGYSVRDEHGLKGMLASDPMRPLKHKTSVPRPDFAIVGNEGSVVELLDAKYRDLWAHRLPPDMLYQLAMYALSRSGPVRRATILYPTMASDARDQAVRIHDPLWGHSRAEVVLRPVNLGHMARLIGASPGAGAARSRREYAKQLAFGSMDKTLN
jgi:5-methylcytosine-specific restriction enzyme subunit McrC